MKARVQNCEACRQQIHKEEQEAYLKKQYAYLHDGINTMAKMSAAVAMAVMVKRGRTKKYIQQFYDDMVMLYSISEIMGKPINLKDVVFQLEKDYDIDFSRLQVNFTETEKEFIKGVKQR